MKKKRRRIYLRFSKKERVYSNKGYSKKKKLKGKVITLARIRN